MPVDHLHRAIEFGRGDERGAGGPALPCAGVQRSQSEMRVGLEGAPSEPFGERQRALIVLTGDGRLARRGEGPQETEDPRLVYPLAALLRVRQRLPRELVRRVLATSREQDLGEG